MCLVVAKNSVFQTSDKDITVYKLLLKHYLNDGYVSPYRFAVYEIGGEYTVDNFSNSGKLRLLDTDCEYIEYGIHTFANLNDAKCYGNDLTTIRFTYVVVESTIPKGTSFFRGIWGRHTASYASEKLILNKIVEN